LLQNLNEKDSRGIFTFCRRFSVRGKGVVDDYNLEKKGGVNICHLKGRGKTGPKGLSNQKEKKENALKVERKNNPDFDKRKS